MSTTMEQVHGVDVSWMTQASPKDKINKKPPPPPASKTPRAAQSSPTDAAAPATKPTSADTKPANASNGATQVNGHASHAPSTNGNAAPAGRRRSRSGSLDNRGAGPNGTPPGRRGSWFSNISSKFSSGHAAQQHQHQHQQENHAVQQPQEPVKEQGEEEEENAVPQPPPSTYANVPRVGPRSAVLPPATKPTGNGPYTPAPPKQSGQGFLGVFRRLSSSSASQHHAAAKLGNGLVERKVLNVDQHRQRCPINELKDAKMRKVSFCVDVEIAPMPKYTDDTSPEPEKVTPIDTCEKKKITEKGEGEALKNPKAVEEEKETEGTPATLVSVTDSSNEHQKLLDLVGLDKPEDKVKEETSEPPKEKEPSKKKEKKKRSEEERKARKEKKRKLAEVNGSIPMELHFDSSDSNSDTPDDGSATKTQTFPTTNPVRIYRRCCQLRESPILKKITEQLLDPTNSSTTTGLVNKLDLTGYWLQYQDVLTLGDYLAVVPVREIFLENSNLNDEGLRVILAGLLAARLPDTKRRKPKHDLEFNGGVVERLVIKNNKLGPDGWKHLSLFLYLCRSLKYLDVSHVQFPRQTCGQTNGTLANGQHVPRGIAEIFSHALSERLGGSTLELLNIGETEPTMEQLGTIIDGVLKSGVKRLGLAHNHLDEQGVEHLSRFLSAGRCEGLDLGGNDLETHLDKIIGSLKGTDSLWAMSLSGCNLKPASLCKIFPTLSKLTNFRFIDLSHNPALFETEPSAVGALRKYLPQMEPLKRIHLQDVGMTSEQAIALVEILPELHNLAHVNILENAELVKLADARTEEQQEEACALYASLMAAARLSKSLICVDIEVPSDQSGEIVKAMAKQVVAYCLRNMERIPDSDIGAVVASAISESQPASKDSSKPAAYPDVLVRLVGNDVLDQDEAGDDQDSAPDEDYVIGGTGVVKALACCLKNRGNDSPRQSGEFVRELEEEGTSAPKLPTGGKAKDMSKHLLAGARQIRHRLQPALNKAKSNPADEQNLRKLMFLDDTLKGIIKRFEDEFPDTREVPAAEPSPQPTPTARMEELTTTISVEDAGAASDGEDESKIHPPKPLSRSSSVLSKLLAEEEGRIHRVGHRFRSTFYTQENIDLLTSIDDIGSDPKHVHVLTSIAEELGGDILELVKEKGPVRAFKEDRETIVRCMKATDPAQFDVFIESQQKARANMSISDAQNERQHNESAIAD